MKVFIYGTFKIILLVIELIWSMGCDKLLALNFTSLLGLLRSKVLESNI